MTATDREKIVEAAILNMAETAGIRRVRFDDKTEFFVATRDSLFLFAGACAQAGPGNTNDGNG